MESAPDPVNPKNTSPPHMHRSSNVSRSKWLGPAGVLAAIMLSVALVNWRGILRDIHSLEGIVPPKSRVPWLTNMRHARTLALANHHLILADFHASWCPPCRQMARDVWTSKRVAAVIQQSFIPLTVDVDSPEGKILSRNYMVQLLPTILLINSHGDVVSAANTMDKTQTLEFLNRFAARRRTLSPKIVPQSVKSP